MDTRKITKAIKPTKPRQADFKPEKMKTVKQVKKKPVNWAVILAVLCALAAILILIIAIFPNDRKKKEETAVKVPYNIQVVKNEQKSVDEGHSPWKLDPVFVTQVFVSLQISPNGIEGKYPINTEDLKLIKMTKQDAVIQVSSKKTPINIVYLKRLVRKDSTGIWTVIAYETLGTNDNIENIPENKKTG